MRNGLIASVAALAALGLLGGCLILAGGGFTSSNKRANWEVFVPAPQAWFMAGIMFALSGIAVLWLLQQTRMRLWLYAVCAMAYLALTIPVTYILKQWLF